MKKLYLDEEDDFLLIKQGQFLYANGISVVIEDQKLKLENTYDYINAIILLKNNDYISAEKCDSYIQNLFHSEFDDIGIKTYYNLLMKLNRENAITKEQLDNHCRDLYTKIYNRRLRKKLDEDQYQYDVSGDQVVMYSGNKYLSATVIKDEDGPRLYVAASDGNKDKAAMNVRMIPFMIREDSPLYSAVDACYRNSDTGNNQFLPRTYSSIRNHIFVEKEDDHYILSVVKFRNDNTLSNHEVAIMDVGNQTLNPKSYRLVNGIYQQIKRYHIEEKLDASKKRI